MEVLFDTKIIVALIAVFVSFVGLLISKEQKTSEFRQEWINTLREDISKFIGQTHSVRQLVNINKTSEEKNETSNNVLLGSVEMRELQSKIELLINPKEEKHIELVQLIDDTIQKLQAHKDIFEYKKTHQESIKKLTSLSQEILKEEWERVKKGEPFFYRFKLFFGITIIAAILYASYKVLCG